MHSANVSNVEAVERKLLVSAMIQGWTRRIYSWGLVVDLEVGDAEEKSFEVVLSKREFLDRLTLIRLSVSKNRFQ